MSNLVDLKTFSDKRGNLTVIERVTPFEIKRIFYIYGVDSSIRGGHRHFITKQAVVCVTGSCKVYCNSGEKEATYELDQPNKCLMLEPNDWHKMFDISSDAVLMILASEYFDEADYIFESY